MNTLALIAITWIGKEYRFLGLDWSYLVILGLIGNATFSMRFLVQWIASERQKESVIPISFWYWSIAGSVIMCLYFVFKRDPVGILAYLPNSLIYLRNILAKQLNRIALIGSLFLCAFAETLRFQGRRRKTSSGQPGISFGWTPSSSTWKITL